MAVPVMVTQAGQVAVQLADNIMVGHLGAAQLAGVSFANAILMMGFVFAIGFCQGLTPVVGQCYGRGDRVGAAAMLCNSALLNSIMTAALMAVMTTAGFLMDRMGQEEAVAGYAKEYYFVTLASFVPMILFFNARFFSEGIGNTKNAMWITVTSNLMNIFLNWVLIYGKLGAPAIGVAGAAYATLISRLFAGIAFLFLFFTLKEYKEYVRLVPGHPVSGARLRTLFALSLPISLQSLLEVTAFSMAAVMVGWMGRYNLAAHQIAQNISSLSFMIATGIGVAATIRVSHQYGSGRYYETFMAGKASVHISVAFMGLCGIVFVAFHRLIPLLYTSDPTVIPIASRIILIMAMYQIFDAVQLASVSSLRGLKDTKVPLLFAALSYYAVCLPSAWFFGFFLGLGPEGVWTGLLLGLAFAAVLFYTRFVKICRRLIKSL